MRVVSRPLDNALRALLLAGAALLIAAIPAAAAADVSSPGARAAFTRHEGDYWVWFGPAAWTAAYSPYGITVIGDDGSGFDLGFSSVLCTAGATPKDSATAYLKAQRKSLGSARILHKSKIATVGSLGPNYFRQKIQIATRQHGTRYLGLVIFDYEVSDPTYCYQRSLAFGAPRAGFGSSLSTLFKVFNSLAYSGPGAFEG